MAYEPTSWKAGDVVTSAKLNKMENGIAGAGPLVIGYSSYDIERKAGALDHTWRQIHDAMASGRPVMASYTEGENIHFEMVQTCVNINGNYSVYVGNDIFNANSADEYLESEPG